MSQSYASDIADSLHSEYKTKQELHKELVTKLSLDFIESGNLLDQIESLLMSAYIGYSDASMTTLRLLPGVKSPATHWPEPVKQEIDNPIYD